MLQSMESQTVRHNQVTELTDGEKQPCLYGLLSAK